MPSTTPIQRSTSPVPCAPTAALAITVLLITTGCSGGGSSNGSSDGLAPAVTITFPTPGSRVDAAAVTVRGTASDLESGVASVTVNGVPATTTDGWTTWSVSIPLTPGGNTLVVEATDLAGNVATQAAQRTVTRQGGFGLHPTPTSHTLPLLEIGVDAAAGKAYTFSPVWQSGARPRFLTIDLATGLRSEIPLTGPRAEAPAAAPIAASWDPAYQRFVYGFENTVIGSVSPVLEIFAVDTLGVTHTLQSPGFPPGQSSYIATLLASAYDPTNDQLLFLNTLGTIVAMHPLTFDRSVVPASSTVLAIGPPTVPPLTELPSNERLLVDQVNGKIYAILSSQSFPSGRIVEVDGAALTRTLIGMSGLTPGLPFHGAAWDTTGRRIITLHRDAQGTYLIGAIEPAAGTYATLSSTPAPGIALRSGLHGTGRAVFLDDEGLKEVDTTSGSITLVSDVSRRLSVLWDVSLISDTEVAFVAPAQVVQGQPAAPGVVGWDLDAGGQTFSWSTPTSAGPELIPGRLGTDPSTGDLWFRAADAFVALDLINLTPTVVSGSSGPGIGPAIPSAHRDVRLHPQAATAYTLGAPDRVIAIDLVTGDRTTVSSAIDGVGTGPVLAGMNGLELDGEDVLVAGALGVFRIDSTTGNRTEVTGVNVGGGYPWVAGGDLALDAASGALLMTDPVQDAVVSIDLATGMRTLVIDRFGKGRLSPVTAEGLMIVAGALPSGVGAVVLDVRTGDWCLEPPIL